ncbi:MAG: hypothetical protein KI785_04470 [Devosiaceae bacterium]|nr:hypothetical protein [Devosiaceae bacterium MH13]
MADFTLKLICPEAPNFIRLEMGELGSRENGFKEGARVPVSSLNGEQMDDLAAEWREKLGEAAKRQREAPANE